MHTLSSTHAAPPKLPTPVADLRVGDIILCQLEGWSQERRARIVEIGPHEVVAERETIQGVFSATGLMRLPKESTWFHFESRGSGPAWTGKKTERNRSAAQNEQTQTMREKGTETKRRRAAEAVPHRLEAVRRWWDFRAEGQTSRQAAERLNPDETLRVACRTGRFTPQTLTQWERAYAAHLPERPEGLAPRGKTAEASKRPHRIAAVQRFLALREQDHTVAKACALLSDDMELLANCGVSAIRTPAIYAWRKRYAAELQEACTPPAEPVQAAPFEPAHEAPDVPTVESASMPWNISEANRIAEIRDALTLGRSHQEENPGTSLKDAITAVISGEDWPYVPPTPSIADVLALADEAPAPVAVPDAAPVTETPIDRGALAGKAKKYALAHARGRMTTHPSTSLADAITAVISGEDWPDRLPIPSLADVLDLADDGAAPEAEADVATEAADHPGAAMLLAENMRVVIAGLACALDVRATETRHLARRLIADGSRFASDLEAAGTILGGAE